MNPVIKALVEFGPLAVFFAGNAFYDIFVATGAFMAASAVALGVSWVFQRKIAAMPLITAGFVFVFGGLTLWLNDETFIKIKPTIVYCLFAAILLGGYLLRRYYLSYVFGSALELDDAGWRKMTLRWGVFFIFLALLNEYIWRNFATDIWVNWKVFGFAPLTVAFALLQTGLIKRHMIEHT